MLTSALSFARETAENAGKIVLNHFRQNIPVDNKQDDSPVTKADKECEAFIREALKKKYPDYGIIGEEFGNENENAEYVWVIDPIDGTKSFIAGVPLFGTLIALMHRNRPVLGIMHQPFTRETWAGADGIPTVLNNKHVHTRTCSALNQAVMMTTDTDLFHDDEKTAFFRLKNAVRHLRQSADCYAYALLATGCIDIVCESDLNVYDFAALIPIIENAGGVVTDWKGNAVTANSVNVLACGNDFLHQNALRLLT